MKLIACMFLAVLMLVAVLLNTPPPAPIWREVVAVGYVMLTLAAGFALDWLSD